MKDNNLDKVYSKLSISVVVLSILMLTTLVWSISIGAIDIPFLESIKITLNTFGFTNYFVDEEFTLVINELRLPRALLAIIVGAGLSISGATLQGLFRNPLSDPALIGLSSGAAVGAVAVIVLGSAMDPKMTDAVKDYLLPLSSFAGAIISTFIAYRIATKSGQTSVSLLLLAGIAINALTSAIYGFFLHIANDAQLRSITFWSLGSVGGATWHNLLQTSFLIIPAIVAMLFFTNKLNLLALGEKEAYYLGMNVQLVKKLLVALVAITVGAAVANCGIIAFMGLLVPHIIRISVGHNFKLLMPLSVMFGGILLLIADTTARTIIAPSELPIGIITTGIGGPFFIWLLLRDRKKETI